MRIEGVMIVADEIDMQILALSNRGYATSGTICAVMAPTVTSEYQQATGTLRDGTVRRHLYRCAEMGLITGAVGNVALTPRGAEILSGLMKLPGGLDDYKPPHVGAICVYSPIVRSPEMVLGSLFYLRVSGQ